MTSARDIAIALGGKRAQRCHDDTYLTCCPVPTHGRGRGDRTPSLALRDGHTRLLVKCFGGCAAPDVLAELRRRGLLSGAHNGARPKPQAIHRTALDATGRKIEVGGHDRMAFGPIGGGAVKLTSDEDVSHALGIAEGVETALSLQRLPEWAGSPVWSVLNENGVRAFPLLAAIETLAIAVDHDPPGEAAAREVTKRWHEAGREVLLFEANLAGADLNDVISG